MAAVHHATVEDLETTRFSERKNAQRQTVEGFWLVTREGCRHWIPYLPRMPVDYYPARVEGGAEEIRFLRIDDKEVTIGGYHLETVLDHIVKRRGTALRENDAPRDVKSTAPYIERITVRDLRFAGADCSPCQGER